MLVLTRRIGEALNFYIGDEKMTVKVLGWAGSQIRIGIDAPADVQIVRKEIDEREIEDNEQ